MSIPVRALAAAGSVCIIIEASNGKRCIILAKAKGGATMGGLGGRRMRISLTACMCGAVTCAADIGGRGPRIPR